MNVLVANCLDKVGGCDARLVEAVDVINETAHPGIVSRRTEDVNFATKKTGRGRFRRMEVEDILSFMATESVMTGTKRCRRRALVLRRVMMAGLSVFD